MENSAVTHEDLPERVTLNGQTWAVCVVPPDDPALNEGDEPIIGACDSTEFRVYLSWALTGPALQNAFLHELCHAFFYTSPVKAVSGSGDEENVEESIVLFATEATFAILSAVDFDFGF